MRRGRHPPELSDKGRWLSSARRHPWVLAFALVATALFVLALLWDWNWFKGPIVRQVEARTGREFDIGGDLDIDLDWRTPTIRADRLRFGNAKWSQQPTMAQAERVQFKIRLWPLLRGQVLIPELQLRRPILHLEMGPGRQGNWKLGQEDTGQAGPGFSRLWIDDGTVTFLDPATRTDFAVDLTSLRSHGRREARPDIALAGHGRWKGAPFQVSGIAESPLHLRDRDRPYRVDIRASAGATRAHARGTVLDPVRMRDFDLKLALSGQDMADLYPLLGIATPPTPPYRLDGRLTREYTRTGTQVWHYDDLTGVTGDSDLAGDASIETGGARPFLRANVDSRRLDFDDLAGFIGKAPQPEESTNEMATQAARDRASPRLLPDRPYRLEKLRAMDADVRYRAYRINAPDWPLEHMETHLRLQNGLLTLEPLNFGVAGGKVRSVVRMDARESPIRTRARIAAKGLDLRQMIPQVERAKDAVGKVGGTVALAGTGNSIAQMLGSSHGEVAVGMGRGQISNLLMELAGIDVAESLKFLVTGDRKVPIRCAFGDFSVSDGVMTTRAASEDFFVAGTNRAMFRFTVLNHLCRELEEIKDTSLPVDRIRQDVSRSPGGDSRLFMNNCSGCHTGMEPHLLLFGGFGFGSAGQVGYLNDLWRYSPSTGQWTWLGGPNTRNGGGIYGTLGTEAAGNQPGARFGAVSWTDDAGNVWMFGGYGVDAGGVLLGYLNDLWRYNPANGRWTWMSGSNTYGAPGVYGTRGTPAPTNVPGSRSYTAATRVGVMLLLFGGITVDAGNNPIALNDLWQYSTSSGQWTWISGSNLPNVTGVYGTKGTPAPANVPGARGGHVVWTAGTWDMYLYVFGGAGFDSVTTQFSQIDDLNDLWRVDLTTGQWTWMNGSNLAGARGVYGTLGSPSVSNQPGARDSGTAWKHQFRGRFSHRLVR